MHLSDFYIHAEFSGPDTHFYPLCLFSFIMTRCVFVRPEQWVGCVCMPELWSNERPHGLQVKRGNTNGTYLTLAVQKAALTEDNRTQKSTGLWKRLLIKSADHSCRTATKACKCQGKCQKLIESIHAFTILCCYDSTQSNTPWSLIRYALNS